MEGGLMFQGLTTLYQALVDEINAIGLYKWIDIDFGQMEDPTKQYFLEALVSYQSDIVV